MNRRHGRRRGTAPRVALGLLIPLALALASLSAAGAIRTVRAEDESSYTDPDFGWSIAWDPETWDAEVPLTLYYGEDEEAIGILFMAKDNPALGQITIVGLAGYSDDAAACLDDFAPSTDQGYDDVSEPDLDLPAAPPDAERGLYLATAGEQVVLGYLECRPLVEDEAVLAISWGLPDLVGYEAGLPLFEELIANLDLGADDQAGDEASDEDSEATEESAAEEDQATEEPDDEDAVDSASYTDPLYGWSIAWDPASWEGQDPIPTVGEDDKPGNQIDFLGKDYEAQGYVRIGSLATVSLDPAACVELFRPRTAEEVEGDGAFVVDLREPDLELPTAAPDATQRLFTFNAGAPPDQMQYLECRTLVEGESVLLIDWYLPAAASYAEALPGFEALIAGIDLSEVHAAEDAG